jgi:phage terminase small subunit
MLNTKQKAFTVEYMKDKNATQAAIRAGYSQKTARSIGNELLAKPDIAQAIAELENAAQVKAGITVEKIVERINRIAEDPNTAPRDRLKADELLGKYLGMFTERVEMKGQLDTTVSKLDGILKQLDE